jgi:hypothetical protein
MTPTEPPDTTDGPLVSSGYRATFYLPNRHRIIIRIADAVALSSGGNDTSRSDVELQTPDRRVVRRVDLTALAAMASDPSAVVASEAHPDYRGTWASEHDYIVSQLAEHLPDFLAWVLACCDRVRLREGYEAGEVAVWSVPHAAAGVLVFESRR